MEIWCKLGALSWPSFTSNNFHQWILTNISGNHAVLFCAGLWSVWRWRNSMVLDPQPWTLDFAWKFCCREYDAFVEFLNSNHDFDPCLPRLRWLPPIEPFVKLNTDGSYLQSAGIMGFGGAIRNANGRWLRGFHGHSTEEGNPFLSELLALKSGLLLLWDTRINSAVCESDCGDLISTVNDLNNRRFHQFRDLLQEIDELLNRNWEIKLVQISREANKVADWLAKCGTSSANSFVFLDDPPLEVEALLLQDLCPPS